MHNIQTYRLMVVMGGETSEFTKLMMEFLKAAIHRRYREIIKAYSQYFSYKYRSINVGSD